MRFLLRHGPAREPQPARSTSCSTVVGGRLRHAAEALEAPNEFDHYVGGPRWPAALRDHSRWRPVLPRFEERFSVLAVDRRGRGRSGDAETYAVEREFEDVAAVADGLGQSTIVLGHSYGGLCALEAAFLTENVEKLVLYDPGLEVAGEQIYPYAVIERLERLLEQGDRDAVVATMLREVAGLPPEVIDQMRLQPAWSARVDAAHTIPRELRAVKEYRFDPERFRDLDLPVLLLSGEASPPALVRAAEVVHDTLSNSRLVILPGQGHAAMDTATELFVDEVIRFADDQRDVSSP